METLGSMLVELRHAPDPRLMLDVTLVRLTNASAETGLAALAARLDKLERALASGAITVARTTPSGPAPRSPEPVASSTPAGGRATLGARAGRAPAPAPAPAAAEPVTSAQPVAEPVAEVAASGIATAATAPGATPTADDLQKAWTTVIQPALKGRAKAFFARGGFVAADRPTFAAPSDMPLARLDENRADVEARLEAHFGRKVPFVIVHDGPAPAPKRSGSPAPDSSAPDQVDDYDESYDPDELVDAPAHPVGEFDRVIDAFPGSELLDEQD